jgi:hypothetical protein
MTSDHGMFSAPSSRAHKLVQDLMERLDQALPGDAHRGLKDTLRDRGASACAFARLGTEEQMGDDLRAMQAALSDAPAGSDEAGRIAELKTLIDASLEELRGH